MPDAPLPPAPDASGGARGRRLLDHPALRRLFHLGALALRGATLGVRGAAFDARGRVCLVRHTYMSGWYLPGGGVEIGETPAQAMAREFREEAGLTFAPEALRLHGLYHNSADSRRDYVALYLAPPVGAAPPKAPDREIAACAYFDPDALPEAATRATRARLAEIRGGLPPDPLW